MKYQVGDIMCYDCGATRMNKSACAFKVTNVSSLGMDVKNLLVGCSSDTPCMYFNFTSMVGRDKLLFRGNPKDIYNVEFKRKKLSP